MDGGIDRIYADHFHWTYGRPYKDVNPLQEVIDAKYGMFKQLPIGEAVLVPVSYRQPSATLSNSNDTDSSDTIRTVKFLIAAPTMVRPEEIEKRSRIVYKASLAAFQTWKANSHSCGIYKVAMPSFGTGFGAVPPIIAAKQMWEAFVDVWGV